MLLMSVTVPRSPLGVLEGDAGGVPGPKSDAGVRDVAIPPHIVREVKAHLASEYVGVTPDALLFAAQSGRHLQPSTLYRHFYKARDAAKRPDLRWHDCVTMAPCWPRRPVRRWPS